MPQGEFNVSTQYESESTMPLQVITVDLGPNNVGHYGPEDINQAKQDQIVAANANPEYRRQATRRYGCVDGRCNAEEAAAAAEDNEYADPQMPGGKAVIETAVAMMTQPDKLSSTLARSTQEAIVSGYEVVVHGANGNKAGCKANEDIRPVLQENASNIDVVTPTALAVAEQLQLTPYVTADYINQVIIAGKKAADTEELWDVDAAGAVDIIVANGGEYVDLQGDHHEKAIRVDLETGAPRKAALVANLSKSDKVIQQFIASLGQYKHDVFEDYARDGKTEAEAAQHVAKAIVYTIGISKHLASPAMPVHLVR